MISEAVVVPRIVRPVEAAPSVPGSKSIANRALVCAALAEGMSTLSNLPDGDDVAAMTAALGGLGVEIAWPAPSRARLTGLGGPPRGGASVEVGLAGTTSRFLVAVGALASEPVTVDGLPALQRRPFGPLVAALDDLGADCRSSSATGGLPITVSGPPTCDRVRIAGDISSQFITALMLIGPMLATGLRIELATELVSRPYVEMTAAVMSTFGATATIDNDEIIIGGGGYTGADLAVEPDASSASYPLALAAITGGTVTIGGLGSASVQGDVRIGELLAAMGCRVAVNPDSITVERSAATPLQGIDVDMADCSDLVPTVAAVASIASTTTRIGGVGFIREKESDRLGDLAAEFTKMGVSISETDDGLIIEPSSDHLRRATIDPHHDHRLAMAAAIVGTQIDDLQIVDPDVVSKSWPTFWADLDTLAGR